jgi:8-oxo-dGTP pyrophosphatase MutT (NUDIX family)
MSSGDGWVICAAGHRHWGRFGAAGLLIMDSERVVLQHRAPWTHDGDTYGVPGGARDSHEDAIAAAVREASEEAGLVRADIDPLGLYFDDHGGWSYSTVVAVPTRPLEPHAANAESVSVSWHPIVEVTGLPLHRGFAEAWPRLRDRAPRLNLQVPAELADDPLLRQLMADGVPIENLASHDPAGRVRSGGVHRLYPHTGPASDTDFVVELHDRDALHRLAG